MGECTVEHCRKYLCVLVVMGSGSVLVCGSTKYVYHKVPLSSNTMPVIGACLINAITIYIYITTMPSPAPSHKYV